MGSWCITFGWQCRAYMLGFGRTQEDFHGQAWLGFVVVVVVVVSIFNGDDLRCQCDAYVPTYLRYLPHITLQQLIGKFPQSWFI